MHPEQHNPDDDPRRGARLPGERPRVRTQPIPEEPNPHTIPASGCAAVSPGSDIRSGAVSKALCTSSSPVTPSSSTPYGCHTVNSPPQPSSANSCPLTLVSASWTPYSSPAATAGSTGPAPSRDRFAYAVRSSARPTMTPMISHCRNGAEAMSPPSGCPATMNAVTPPASRTSPAQPCRPSGCRACRRERASAKTRLVASSGSTRLISPWPSAIAPSAMPHTISPIPPSQRGTRIRTRTDTLGTSGDQ